MEKKSCKCINELKSSIVSYSYENELKSSIVSYSYGKETIMTKAYPKNDLGNDLGNKLRGELRDKLWYKLRNELLDKLWYELSKLFKQGGSKNGNIMRSLIYLNKRRRL